MFKNIEYPSYGLVLRNKELCLAGWEEQLSHQLQVLPSGASFWNQLPLFFQWLLGDDHDEGGALILKSSESPYS